MSAGRHATIAGEPMSSCQVVIESLEHPDGVRVAVEGELAGPSAYTLDSELRKIEATRPRWMVLDLSALAFIDSAGLARLLAARRLIALTALDQQLEVFSDGPSAVAAAHA